MDKNVEWLNEKRIEKTIKALEENNMNVYFVKNKEELIETIEKIVDKDAVVSCGGSDDFI